MRLTTSKKNRGSVLLVTIFTFTCVSLVAAVYLNRITTNTLLTARSEAWNAALPIAEAGVEEALTHLNFHRGQDLDLDNWTHHGSTYYKSRVLNPDAYYGVSLEVKGAKNNKKTVEILSIGSIRAPLGTNYISRTIVATATQTNVFFSKAMVAKKHIRAGHGTLIDSY